MAARWWSTPARLALSMSGSMLVGIAEVVVYWGYIRRVRDAKSKAKDLQEVKEVMKTWVVGGVGDGDVGEKLVAIGPKEDSSNTNVRQRKKDPS